ncbi:putative siderophore transport system ATP-binding protein YusV [Clostridiales bacterium]|nr:putative siderophore transport system ATP-binding protein YusV [Clostridiales bacterium]
MIELENVDGGYGKKQILFNINAVMKDGEITSIIGPNGCGKSTLLETASGLMKPFGGTVTFDGENIHKMSPKYRAKKISVISQQKNPGILTVKSLVLHGRFPYLGYPRKYTKNDIEIVDKAMMTAGVYDEADRSLSELSGGQQQKVYIAMLLAQDTEVAFMDEPITFLDINYQLELMDIIMGMKRNGKTVIMVIHDLNLAMRYSDKIIAMDRGRIIFTGTPEELYEKNILKNLFGVDTHFSKAEGQYFFTRQKKY